MNCLHLNLLNRNINIKCNHHILFQRKDYNKSDIYKVYNIWISKGIILPFYTLIDVNCYFLYENKGIRFNEGFLYRLNVIKNVNITEDIYTLWAKNHLYTGSLLYFYNKNGNLLKVMCCINDIYSIMFLECLKTTPQEWFYRLLWNKFIKNIFELIGEDTIYGTLVSTYPYPYKDIKNSILIADKISNHFIYLDKIFNIKNKSLKGIICAKGFNDKIRIDRLKNSIKNINLPELQYRLDFDNIKY